MSYDYCIARVTRPIASAKEFDMDAITSGDWSGDFRRAVERRFPNVVWSAQDYGFYGTVPDAGGRLGFSCRNTDGRVFVVVNGSFHADQRESLCQLAADMEASLFDAQSGEILRPQTFFT
jgi:hypothetical protein